MCVGRLETLDVPLITGKVSIMEGIGQQMLSNPEHHHSAKDKTTLHLQKHLPSLQSSWSFVSRAICFLQWE